MTTTDERMKALREALGALGQDTRHLSDDELLAQALGRGPRTAPAWAAKDAAGRVAALREDYERAGDDVSDVSDLELLNRELGRANAESNRHSSAFMLLLQDQVKHDRSVYAAAMRQAREAVDARGGMYLEAIVRRSALPLTGLVHRVTELPERPGPKVVEELKAAAQRVKWQLDGVVTRSVLDEVARTDEGVKLVDAQAAEIQRLRESITAQGHRLHDEHAAAMGRASGRCECPGCELIRSMDDDRETEAAA